MPVQPNPDPKPGRWILPVVIVAMMGFAWLFISAADEPIASANDTTTTSPGSGSNGATTTTSSTTTTTLLPAAVAQYQADLATQQSQATTLLESARQINSAWDDRTATFNETLAALRNLEGQVVDFQVSVSNIAVPVADLPNISQPHAALLDQSNAMVTQAGAMVAGLQAPDTGEARRAALQGFETAVNGYTEQSAALIAFETASGDSVLLSVDDSFTLYVNGSVVGSGSDWTQPGLFALELSPGVVVGVEATDSEGVGGLIAQVTADGTTYDSNAEWRVSTNAETDWQLPAFDDSSWDFASSYGAYGVTPWETNVAGFSSSTAEWIWSSDNQGDDRVFFRFVVP